LIKNKGAFSAAKLLPAVLSVIAGSCDVIGFLGLGGLFTAHVTGNLVILAAHMVSGEAAQVAPMLSVPVFMVMLGLTRLVAAGCDSVGLAPLRPLLLLQFLLLAGFLALGVAAGPHVDPNAAHAILAGMLGVSAMAVQNALVPLALKGVPTTAVMTTNITRFTVDLGELLLGRDAGEVERARHRAKQTGAAIAGFVVGCALGGAGEAAVGLWSLALPVALALVALGLAFAAGGAGARG
jgi:uncharacterized membrane protein YoaK (UPF0700 family)